MVRTIVDPSNLRRTFARLTRAPALGHWHPPELRHTACSILNDAGIRLENVADLLGHETTRITATVYWYLIRPTVDVARGTMDELFGKKRDGYQDGYLSRGDVWKYTFVNLGDLHVRRWS